MADDPNYTPEQLAEIQQSWQQRHGFTPIDWNIVHQALGYEAMRARPAGYNYYGAESRPFSYSNVDLPYLQSHVWRPSPNNGYYNGGGGGFPSKEQRDIAQQNFLTSTRNQGMWYDPQAMAGFADNGWWMREGYEPDNADQNVIEPGSFLWDISPAYRSMYQQTTPEIQAVMRDVLVPEYQRRDWYSQPTGITRYMR